MDSRTFYTVKQFSQRHPVFSESSLRYLIFNERHNGLSPAIRRVGRKVLIDEDKFFEWLDRQNGQAE